MDSRWTSTPHGVVHGDVVHLAQPVHRLLDLLLHVAHALDALLQLVPDLVPAISTVVVLAAPTHQALCYIYYYGQGAPADVSQEAEALLKRPRTKAASARFGSSTMLRSRYTGHCFCRRVLKALTR